jgi:hypothetical protein
MRAWRGAAYSVPPATGQVRGDSLTLDLPYVGGAFHDTFVYDPSSDSWTMRLDAAGCGGWGRLYALRRVPGDAPMTEITGNDRR